MTQVDQVGFSCAACGKQYRWKPELAGKTVKCKCGNPLKVPRAMGAASAAAAPAQPQAGIAAARASAEVPPRPAKAAKPAPTEDGGGGGDLDALMALAQQEAASADDAAANADAHFCANCRNRMSPDAVICMNCGFDRRKGNVLAVAKVKDPNARRLFGLLGPKKEKAGKPVDKMAPQGSFIIGLCASFGLALAASFIWFLVAWGVGWDVYFLVMLVGVGAGVGMQIGQKGYSTLGGFAAVGVTLVVMILARFAVILAIVVPMMAEDAEAGAFDDEDPTAPTREEIQPFDPDAIFKPRTDISPLDPMAGVGPRQDPRVLAKVSEKVYADFGINPEFASGDQHNAVALEAQIRATTMPADVKQKMIEEMDKKAEHERLISMLVSERVDEILEVNPAVNIAATMDGVRQQVMEKVRKMTPEDEKKEMARLKEAEKTRRAEMRKKWKAEADAEAAADGFDSAEPGAESADEEMDEDEDEDAEETAAPADQPAAPAQGARPSASAATPAAAAAAGANARTATTPGAGEEEEDGDSDGVGTAVGIGLGAMLILIFFGGFKSFLFMLGSLFLAYRTAAGSTWG